MAASKTVKFQLHVPDLEELCQGERFFMHLHQNRLKSWSLFFSLLVNVGFVAEIKVQHDICVCLMNMLRFWYWDILNADLLMMTLNESLLICNSAGKGTEEELWRGKSVCEWVSRSHTGTLQVSCQRYEVSVLNNQLSKPSQVLGPFLKKWFQKFMRLQNVNL